MRNYIWGHTCTSSNQVVYAFMGNKLNILQRIIKMLNKQKQLSMKQGPGGDKEKPLIRKESYSWSQPVSHAHSSPRHLSPVYYLRQGHERSRNLNEHLNDLINVTGVKSLILMEVLTIACQ